MEVASAVRTSSLDFAELSNLANQGVMFAPTTYGMTRSDKTGRKPAPATTSSCAIGSGKATA